MNDVRVQWKPLQSTEVITFFPFSKNIWAGNIFFPHFPNPTQKQLSRGFLHQNETTPAGWNRYLLTLAGTVPMSNTTPWLPRPPPCKPRGQRCWRSLHGRSTRGRSCGELPGRRWMVGGGVGPWKWRRTQRRTMILRRCWKSETLGWNWSWLGSLGGTWKLVGTVSFRVVTTQTDKVCRQLSTWYVFCRFEFLSLETRKIIPNFTCTYFCLKPPTRCAFSFFHDPMFFRFHL